jgi:hypothetical protein
MIIAAVKIFDLIYLSFGRGRGPPLGGKVRVLRAEIALRLHQSTLTFPCKSMGPFLSQRRGKEARVNFNCGIT